MLSMNLLYTTDLHSRRDWYEWLLEKAEAYDLLVISGDLLDSFSEESIIDQVYILYLWCQKLADLGIPLVLCSGNHDAPMDLLSEDFSLAKKADWNNADFVKMVSESGCWLGKLPGVICSDEENLIFKDKLLLSSCGYAGGDETQEKRTQSLLKVGYQIKCRQNFPWIILHHEPPKGVPLSKVNSVTDMGDPMLASWIREYKPDIVLSGHIHHSPFIHNKCVSKLYNSYCFNAGHDPEWPEPTWASIRLTAKVRSYEWYRGDKLLGKGKIEG